MARIVCSPVGTCRRTWRKCFCETCRVIDMRTDQKGSALLMVILLLSIVAFSFVGANLISDANMDNQQLVWSRKKAFYVAEALRHASITITKEYFGQTLNPEAATLKTDLETNLLSLITASYPEYYIEHPVTQEANKILLDWTASPGESPI